MHRNNTESSPTMTAVTPGGRAAAPFAAAAAGEPTGFPRAPQPATARRPRVALPTPRPARARSLRELYTPGETIAVLRRERGRIDRRGGEFSLVLFKVEGCLWPSGPMLKLGKIVQDRCRETDEVGRFDGEYLCAILPDTGPAGAWRFAAGVCERAQSKLMRPLCVVYTYPTAWFKNHNKPRTGELHDRSLMKIAGGDGSADDGDDDGRDTPAATGDAESVTHDGSMPPQLGGQALVPFLLDGITAGGVSHAQAVERLEALLVRPMPWWKRALDVLGAGVGILLLAPLLLLGAILVKLSGPGPIIFMQKRAGMGGRPFTIYKFRTMCTDAEAKKAALRARSEQDGPAFKLTNDPRITPIGRFLRGTSIDELPQLWNVIKGDMSLVGPRPLPVEESDNCDPWHRRRLEVTPGLTCIWQVEGRSRVTFDEWMRMDARYIRRRRRLWRDVLLMARTVPAVLAKRGAR